VNYDVVNGKRVFKDSEQQRYDSDPDYKKKTGVEKYQYPFPQYGKGYIDSTGNYITRKSPENNIKNYRPVERETLAAYGAKMWTDLFPTSESLGISKHGQAWQYTLNADTNAIVTEADNYMKNALANIVLGKPENFDKSWAKIQDDLKKMGIEKANAEMTRMVKEKVAMWGAK
jgi:putative aldouronate transport system substrate-binding protein